MVQMYRGVYANCTRGGQCLGVEVGGGGQGTSGKEEGVCMGSSCRFIVA